MSDALPEPGADQQGPDPGDHGHLAPLGAAASRIGGRLVPQRGHQKEQDARHGEQGEQVVSDRDARRDR